MSTLPVFAPIPEEELDSLVAELIFSEKDVGSKKKPLLSSDQLREKLTEFILTAREKTGRNDLTGYGGKMETIIKKILDLPYSARTRQFLIDQFYGYLDDLGQYHHGAFSKEVASGIVIVSFTRNGTYQITFKLGTLINLGKNAKGKSYSDIWQDTRDRRLAMQSIRNMQRYVSELEVREKKIVANKQKNIFDDCLV
jgi:hypothetical protein